MREGIERVVHYEANYELEVAPVLIHRLKEGKWFGFAEVDIKIPEPLHARFEVMCPFFYNKEVPVKAVPLQMLDYLQRTGRKRVDGQKLVGALSAENLVVYALCCAGTFLGDLRTLFD